MKSNQSKLAEQAARRIAARLGLRLSKSRSMHGFTGLHHSGARYMVCDERNIVVDYGNDLSALVEKWRGDGRRHG